jgi:hypothetical protein
VDLHHLDCCDAPSTSELGRNPNLPRRNSNFTSISGHAAASSRPRSGARCCSGRSATTFEPGGRLAPTIAELQAGGCESLRAIAAGLEERGIPAARGGKWSTVQGLDCWRRLAAALSTQAPPPRERLPLPPTFRPFIIRWPPLAMHARHVRDGSFVCCGEARRSVAKIH